LQGEESERQAAWEDSDDERVTVRIDTGRAKKLRRTEADVEISGKEYAARLRAFHADKVKGSKDWAALPDWQEAGGDDDSEADDADITGGLEALLRRSGGVVGVGNGKKLGPTTIEMKKMKDANQSSPSNAVIQTTAFHPTLPLLFTAGFDKTLRIFQVDGETNPKLQGVFLPDLPIRRAAWLPDTNEVLMVGRRKFFYTYNLQSSSVAKIHEIPGRDEKSLEDMTVSRCGRYIGILGNNGYVVMLDARTRLWIDNFKLNGTARSLSFSADGSQLGAAGGDGLVTLWDVGTRKVMSQWQDEGAIKTTALIQSPNGEYWATGADSGVVNIYRSREVVNNAAPRPIRAVMNLTTQIDSLVFNADSQLLACSSRFKQDSLKVVHVESSTVYANWPTQKTPLRTVASIDFSPNSGYLAIGNDRGKALLYRLQHYQSA